jgi:hypothetical protein
MKETYLTGDQKHEIENLIKKNHNDGDLGREIRKLFFSDSIVKKFPNNMDLGSEIRKIYQNLKK